MAEFKIHSDYQPTGDQPQAIAALTEGVQKGFKHQVLLGVTGSGKTFTMANIIKNLGRPALVIAHNKTLAAQLAGEFREFFPENAVGYFVSYYDYTSPRRTSLPRTPSSKRTPPSTTRSTACATAPPRGWPSGATWSSSPRSAASTVWATRRNTRASPSPCAKAWSSTATSFCAGLWRYSTSATTLSRNAVPSACAATWWRSSPPHPTKRRCASNCSATRSSASPRWRSSPATYCATSPM